MSRRKKLINETGFPQHAIDALARCIWPDILAAYEQEMNRMKDTITTKEDANTQASA